MRYKYIINATAIFYLLILASLANAQSNVISITHTPSLPTAGSEVTFYAKIDGKNISEVKVWIEECSNATCSLPKEINMIKENDRNYTITYKLKEDTIYFHYKVKAKVDGKQVESEMHNVSVIGKSEGGENNTENINIGNTEKTTPGFEIIEMVAILSVIIALSALRKR